MTQAEVEQYIKNQLRLKRPVEEIGNDLLSKAVDSNTIDMAFANTKPASVGFKKKSLTGSIILSAALIIIGILRLAVSNDTLGQVVGYILIATGIVTLIARLVTGK